jgi:hypothetical protein
MPFHRDLRNINPVTGERLVGVTTGDVAVTNDSGDVVGMFGMKPDGCHH